jgi:hypothetical protein
VVSDKRSEGVGTHYDEKGWYKYRYLGQSFHSHINPKPEIGMGKNSIKGLKKRWLISILSLKRQIAK